MAPRCICGHLRSRHREPNMGNRICGPGSCPCAEFRGPVAGIGATNAHRLARVLGPGGAPVAPWWYCAAPGCTWHPLWPAKVHGSAKEQFASHLYDLVPKGVR